MRRFDQSTLFDRLAERHLLTTDHVISLAQAVAAFHAAAEPITGGAEVGGGASGMAWVIEDNIAELAERADLFAPKTAAHLAQASRTALDRERELLDDRLAHGFVRRCHGDLHLRNICLVDGSPTLFDAIEFNDRLSCIDVWYDLAFLLMDLDHRGLRPFANAVFNRYAQQSEDIGALAALPLFLSARAAVRAQVSASAEASQADEDHSLYLREEAARYFAAAAGYLRPPGPQLVAIGGLSGSGKTSVARWLAPEVGAAPGALHLRSDVIRKHLLGVAELDRLPDAAYGSDVTDRVYASIVERAMPALGAGHCVIADAVYARAGERRAIEDLANRCNVPFVGLWLEAPANVLLERTAQRRLDASDATPDVVKRQLAYELGPIRWTRLDAGGQIDVIREAALRILSASA